MAPELTGPAGPAGSNLLPQGPAGAQPGPPSAGSAGPLAPEPAPLPAGGLDRADIRALDVAAALLILTTEILDSWGMAAPRTAGQTPPQAAAWIVDALLKALPAEHAGARAWLEAEAALQAGIAAGLGRATALVSARGPADPAVEAALPETHALITAALAEDAATGLLLRPEWSALAPRLQAWRRRRRTLRRRLQEPDDERWEPVP